MVKLPSTEARERAMSRVLLKPGVHEMKVTDVTEKIGYESGDEYWRVVFESVDVEGGFAVQNYSFVEKAWPYTRDMFLGLGINEEEMGDSMEPEVLFGLTGSFRIATRRGARPSNRIVEPILTSDEERLEEAELVAAELAPANE